ncbi:MAG: DMT family transporter [Thiotrichaceae bacterium]|nr:DMT family transporter [Thiotrichaceae bacterium]
MRVAIAFMSCILIWSTTPLTISWSVEDTTALFSVTTRMILGTVFATVFSLLLGKRFQLHLKAYWAYLASGIGIYGSMIFVYWGALYIDSAWIAILWGLSPMVTGVLAYRFLGENSLSKHRLIGASLGLLGLLVIFYKGSLYSGSTGFGVVLILMGVLVQTSTAVWIKHIDAQIDGLIMSAAGLIVSVPFFILTWWIFDGMIPETISSRATYSILYLAFLGSVIGFSAYYYLLNHVEASKVSLIAFITPVSALFLGHYLNNEPITLAIAGGTGLILLGLLSYEWGSVLRK